MDLLSPFRQLRRRLLIHRRGLAALAVVAAVLVGLQAVRTPPPPTVPVWTAARDLPSGTVLAGGDLRRTEYAAGSVPDAAISSPRQVLGRQLAAPLTHGEPVTRGRVLTGELLAGYPGTTAVPLRITDPGVVDLLRVGDRISLVVADPDGRSPAETLAEDVPVVAIPRRPSGLDAASSPAD